MPHNVKMGLEDEMLQMNLDRIELMMGAEEIVMALDQRDWSEAPKTTEVNRLEGPHVFYGLLPSDAPTY